MSNVSKFAEYITDSVRPVEQNSRHSPVNINKIKTNVYLMHYMPSPIPSLYYYLSFP